ncbi:RecX family transcriptional regulator [Sphingopyxis alaskensis]|jgi:regulatory protein|uniref:RecX family transcriptional regulator n=1 Tax=Sphingopyxis alaskensis TaxID=117207 RepID=UPI0002FD6CF1|nr:RecX family transcriptional regulator [Sphingopyxis alaskensis]MCM3418921.1 RecX family transcriptional regulator [Sphingopyxis alaskensis]
MPKHPAPFDRSKRPLGAAKLDELALAYVARFATSRAKLLRYLARKVRESEWMDESDAMAACEAVADRMERLHYLDDRQYAAMRAGAMTRRGLGVRRVRAQLYVDGIAEADSGEAIEAAESAAVAAAIGFARRRRLGPFAARGLDDPKLRERQVAAFVRAGHSPALARHILGVAPGDADALAALDAGAALD